MENMDVAAAWAVVTGVIVPFVVSVITRSTWTSQVKRWAAIGVSAALGLLQAVLLGVITSFDWTLQGVVINLAVVIGIAQTFYTLLKPTHVTDKIEAKVNRGGGGAAPADLR